MAGSNMFIIYESTDGNNVTVSPRLGTGYVMPKYNSAADISVLEGSGVSGGVMTANVRCGSCLSWDGGSMDFSSSSSQWIYGYRSGSSLASDSVEASISQHNAASSFTLDLSAARSSLDGNPFTSSSDGTGSASASGSSGTSVSCTPISSATSTLASPSGSGCPTAWPTEFTTAWPTARPTWAASCFANDNGNPSWPTDAPWANGDAPWNNYDYNYKRQSSNGCPAGYAPVSGSSSSSSNDGNSKSNSEAGSSSSANFQNAGFNGMSPEQQDMMVTAHGALAALAFVAVFPIGGILVRLASFTALVWVHAALQAFGFLIYIAAFGIGVWLATNLQELDNAHAIIGIVLFVLLFAQPVLGLLHHRAFKKVGHRTWSSYGHLTLGRVAILLGIVNGGLGLRLAGAEQASIIAYGVVAGLVGLVYIAVMLFGEVRRKRHLQNSPPTYNRSQKDNLELQSSGDSNASREASQPREYYGT